MNKKEFRRHFSEVRLNAKTPLRDRLIAERLLNHERVRKADCVLLYASFRSEINTWDFADELLRKGVPVCFPICGEDRTMTFFRTDSVQELLDGEKDSYGICIPSRNKPCPPLTENTVCIVPGLAFTEEGFRLGYGGGYYDRFLSENPQVYTIAAAYEDLITDELPVLQHDCKVNSIVTEERTVICNG